VNDFDMQYQNSMYRYCNYFCTSASFMRCVMLGLSAIYTLYLVSNIQVCQRVTYFVFSLLNLLCKPFRRPHFEHVQGGSNMTGTINVQFTHKSVPVIFESPCISTHCNVLYRVPHYVL
jgi:hypothetical protein